MVRDLEPRRPSRHSSDPAASYLFGNQPETSQPDEDQLASQPRLRRFDAEQPGLDQPPASPPVEPLLDRPSRSSRSSRSADLGGRTGQFARDAEDPVRPAPPDRSDPYLSEPVGRRRAPEPPEAAPRSHRAAPAEPERMPVWPSEAERAQQPATTDEPKKSRREKRRDRKKQPDETEVWLSGLSSSEPMAWESAPGSGRTAPNDGLGLAEDIAEITRPASRPKTSGRGSLFDDDGEDTWNTPAPATDGDDWWESTPRRSRRDRDRKD